MAANLSKINVDTNWQDAASIINQNYQNIDTALDSLKMTTSVKMPMFGSVDDASQNITNPYIGQLILVGSSLPAPVYKWNGENWEDTGMTGGDAEVILSDFVKYAETGTINDVII